ncbi:hypothetical protein [Mycobacterium sp.]|uniref:hypothetical protein n=1 Tax=Mycobacterium sp. TaxID=1785 RepID=UPI00120922C3|nr:hypothetical protein [Mycobacterium sp.]TAM64460.1 MAG: hypothetical protein EPN51_23505 [Mycobacterium sp.]
MLNPTCPELLRAVIANLDELVLPQLEGPHARSSVKNMKLLLTHVIHRLEHEGPELAADNAEKRVAITELVELAPDLDGAAELGRRLEKIPSAGSYVAVATLADEAGQLRQLAIDASLLVHGNTAALGQEKADELLAPLRRQLRAQLGRDLGAVAHITPSEVYDHKGA